MADGRVRVAIEAVRPQVDGGRFPIKRAAGESVRVEADIFTDGHDLLSALLLWRRSCSVEWETAKMQAGPNDRWYAEFPVPEIGRYLYSLEAWVDRFKTWRRDLLKRIAAAQDAPIDYKIGAEIVDDAASRAGEADRRWLEDAASSLRNGGEHAREAAVAPSLEAMMARYPDKRWATRFERELEVVVDPVWARFSAWYEFFPRSASPEPGRHATLREAEAMLPYIASMGFDVVYLPPVHPIGRTWRKGRNNSLSPSQADVGSPWAIGSAEGGHKSVHPDLGTIEDFRRFVACASNSGLRVAIDIAFQASPDHPYAAEHPEWFRSRPDGTIQYAENPPKKYQDIYPFDFESGDWEAMWNELKSIFLFWIEQGVTIFRVDNPHTKAFPFWEWCITGIKEVHPETVFLSEAFTRPKVMYRLAKLGFTQSYTYFPWRHTKWEITSYCTELAQTDIGEFFRPNHWPNTPDILTEFLQTSGRPGFVMRLILAATLGAAYGIYGPPFELMEHTPREPGSEEYLDSEKYELRHWDLNREDSLRDLIALTNRIRRENVALQSDRSLRFHPVDNEHLICYTKHSRDFENLIVVVVNLDPNQVRGGMVELPLGELQIDGNHPYQMHEMLTGARYIWTGARNYVELDPKSVPAHIFRVRRRLRSEREFEYFL